MILGTKTSLGKGIVTILICKKLIILYFICFIKINLHIFAKIKTKNMETHLTIKHLAPYLPYDLKCDIFFAQQSMGTCVWRIRILDCFYLDKLKNNLEFIRPILRPLSDFNKVIEVNGEKFVPIEWFEISDVENNSVDYGKGNVKIIGLLKDISKYNFIDLSYINYCIVEKFIEWHFDIFGLIEQGLAIDINTL